MANNRLRLKCTVCGKLVPLAKWYPSSGWYASPGFEERYEENLDQHKECALLKQHGDIFIIEYEIESKT